MAIEVSVRKEIKNYQEKLIFGLSLRQAACAGIAIVVSVLVGVLNYFILHISIDDLGLLLMILIIPILALGWFKKENMTLEKHLKIVKDYHSLARELPYLTLTLKKGGVESDEKKEGKNRSEYGN